MMAPAITAPPTMPAATPGPHPHPPPCHPHPRPRHCAEASVAVAARVATIVAATTKIVSIFFIAASLAWQAPTEQNWRLPEKTRNAVDGQGISPAFVADSRLEKSFAFTTLGLGTPGRSP